MSYLIHKEDAKKAVGMLLPAIKAAMKKGIVKRSHLHIVVLSPGAIYDPTIPFGDFIIYEESLEAKKWENDYETIAKMKARATLRTGLPSLYLVQRAPHLLREADTKYGGSVNLDGIIVACSGVQSHFDEMFSMWIAAAIKGIGIEKMQEALKDTKEDFLH